MTAHLQEFKETLEYCTVPGRIVKQLLEQFLVERPG
jgi:hypothetical protein